MFLPTIYWLDGNRTKQYLEMLVEDLMTEYSIKKNNEAGNEINIGGKSAKIVAKYEARRGEKTEIEGNVSRSNAALFKDLYTILKEKNIIQSLIGFDEDILNQLNNGEFIELTGEFKQSPVELVLSSTMDIINKYKGHFEAASSKEEMDNISAATTFFNFKSITMIIHPYMDGEYKFYTNLDSKSFVEDRYDLEGEFTILGKIKRKYKAHEKIDLIKLLPGRMRMKKEELMGMIPNLDDSSEINFDVEEITEESFELKGPVIEITPIAIYQE